MALYVKTKIKQLRMIFFLIFLREFRYEQGKIKYSLKDVKLRKVFNLLKTVPNRDFKTPFVWGHPFLIHINPFLGCNLRCPKCPSNVENRIKKGPLSFDVFKKFIDEVGDYALFLTFWGWGEPFLNKNLPEMIRYAKDKGIIVRTSTNGNLLDNSDFNKRILLSGLDTLIIALDGVTEETYLRYRKDGDFMGVIKGIKDLVELKKELGVKKPLINLRMVVMRNNEHEVPNMKELAKKLDVDVLTFKSVNPNLDNKTADEMFIPRNTRYHRYAYSPGTLEKIEPEKYSCYFPWFEATMLSDGTIVACEFDYNAEHAFGNIKEQTFKEIWFGEKANNFRKMHSKDHAFTDFCEKCPYTGMIIDGCVFERFDLK